MQRFYGFEVIAGKEHPLKLKAGDGFHLSLISLPHNCNGHCSLYVLVDGKTYAIATLDSKLNILQACTDLVFASTQDAVFHVNGSGRVNCTGYVQPLLDEEDESSDEDDIKAITNEVNTKESIDEKEDSESKKAPFGVTESDEEAAEEEDEDELDSDNDEEIDEEEDEEEDEDEDEDDDEDVKSDNEFTDAKEEAVEQVSKKAKPEITSPNRTSQQQQQGRPSQQQQQGRPSQQQQQGRLSQQQQQQGRPSQQQQQQGRPSQQQQQGRLSQQQQQQGRPSQQQQQQGRPSQQQQGRSSQQQEHIQ